MTGASFGVSLHRGPVPAEDSAGVTGTVGHTQAVDPATARIVLAHHGDNEGMCAGCHTQFQVLTPFPCSQTRWAVSVIGASTAVTKGNRA